MKRRQSLTFLVAVSAIVALLLAGCAAREAIHPLSTYVVPDYEQRGIETVGLMPIGDQTNSEVAPSTVLSLLERRAAEETTYMFLSEEEVLGRAREKGVGDEYRTLASVWRKESRIDEENAVSVGSASRVDALLFVEIFLWNKEWVARNTEGTSRSQVGIRVVMVSAETGEELWGVSDEQGMESGYYSPESGIGTYVDEAGMVRASSLGGVPDPPPIEEVARRVLDAIFGVLP